MRNVCTRTHRRCSTGGEWRRACTLVLVAIVIEVFARPGFADVVNNLSVENSAELVTAPVIYSPNEVPALDPSPKV